MSEMNSLNEWSNALGNMGLPVQPEAADLSRMVSDLANSERQLVDVSALRVVDVTGEDAASFLQSQFCNDLTQVNERQGQISGYCNPKGRLLGLPLVVAIDDGFRLLLPQSVVDAFVKRLSMYVLRAKVSITGRDDLVVVGLRESADEDAGQWDGLADPLPAGLLGVNTTEDSQTVRWFDQVIDGRKLQRYLRVAPVSEQLALWKTDGSWTRAAYASWLHGDITAGIPAITASVVEAFVPQMINLQFIDALSFTKGCYPGQEIVARMQYLGKLKRQMRLYAFSSADAIPVPGDTVQCNGDADAGTVVTAVADVAGTGLLLAVVKIDHLQSDTPDTEQGHSASAVQWQIGDLPLYEQALPYSLSPAEASDTNVTEKTG